MKYLKRNGLKGNLMQLKAVMSLVSIFTCTLPKEFSYGSLRGDWESSGFYFPCQSAPQGSMENTAPACVTAATEPPVTPKMASVTVLLALRATRVVTSVLQVMSHL